MLKSTFEVHPHCHRNCVYGCACKPQYFAVIKELGKHSDILLSNGVMDEVALNIVPVNSEYMQFKIVPITNIIDLCVYVQLNDCENTAFISVSPNSTESDWLYSDVSKLTY